MTTISAEVIGNNIDLLTQILIRVPTEPLVRSKCVSKQWLSLISDPQFCLFHTRHHQSQYPTPTALLLKKPHVSILEFEMVPIKPDIMIPKVPSFDFLNALRFRIRQSCNGLLLCSSISNRQYFYHICNPTTKKFKRLSPSPCQFRENSVTVSAACMALDPLKSSHYKLIYVCRVIKTDKHHIDMYSSETDSWSPLEITFTPPNRVNFSNPVFCNGALHWYSNATTSVYFDVDTECFNPMPMPDLDQREVHYFGESRGHLHLIVTEFPHPLQFDVLEMTPDYSGWFVRYHVNLCSLRTVFPKTNPYRCYPIIQLRFSVLHVIRAQKEEESIVVVSVDSQIFSCNVHDRRKSKKLCDLEPHQEGSVNRPSYFTWSNTFQYFESLTSV